MHHIHCSDAIFLVLSGANKKINNSGRHGAPSHSSAELNAVSELRAFLFFCFMPRAHRANEVTCGSYPSSAPALETTRPSITSRTSRPWVPTAWRRERAATPEPAVAGWVTRGSGWDRTPRSRSRRPPFNDRRERRPAARPRPPPPPDWPAAVCCPVAKAMPATDWWGAGGGGEGAGFAACPRRAGAVPRGAVAARSRSEREEGGMCCPQSRPYRLPSPVPSPEGSRRGAGGGRVRPRCAAGARRVCESGGAGGAPRAPVQAGRFLLQPALIDSSALVYRGVAGLLSWQEGGEPGGEQRSHSRKHCSPHPHTPRTKLNKN